METELGFARHEYLWVAGRYYRRRLYGTPEWETFDGKWTATACPPLD